VVLTGAGDLLREYYRPQRAQLGQLALVEMETARGKPQCHFVPDIRLDRDGARALLDQHVSLTGDRLGQIRTIDPASRRRDGTVECVIDIATSSQITLRMDAPSPNAKVLIHPCGACSEQGSVTCEACAGQGTTPCDGRYRCGRCNGSGNLQDGRDCLICGMTGFVAGCQGSAEIDCPVCSGQGQLACDRCGGTGEYQPRRTCPKCHGTGEFTVTCNKCGGTGEFRVSCRKCGGSGSVPAGTCYSCDGSGQKSFDCTPCSGTGSVTLACTPCGGQGYWEAKPCDACSGHGTRECFYCHGDRRIRCTACHGEGLHRCRPCNGNGRIYCRECSGQGALLRAVVECDVSRTGERP
jgi:cellular nucleic acid-binding protein